MNIGFTGSQEGMTSRQKMGLRLILFYFPNIQFRHGDCVGADEEAHKIAREAEVKQIVIYPPDSIEKRAFCEAKEIAEPMPYLKRNKRIVDFSSVLVACPRSSKEEQRSGTWATIRYARNQDMPIFILEP